MPLSRWEEFYEHVSPKSEDMNSFAKGKNEIKFNAIIWLRSEARFLVQKRKIQLICVRHLGMP
jgi:hypothetical protein